MLQNNVADVGNLIWPFTITETAPFESVDLTISPVDLLVRILDDDTPAFFNNSICISK